MSRRGAGKAGKAAAGGTDTSGDDEPGGDAVGRDGLAPSHRLWYEDQVSAASYHETYLAEHDGDVPALLLHII